MTASSLVCCDLASAHARAETGEHAHSEKKRRGVTQSGRSSLFLFFCFFSRRVASPIHGRVARVARTRMRARCTGLREAAAQPRHVGDGGGDTHTHTYTRSTLLQPRRSRRHRSASRTAGRGDVLTRHEPVNQKKKYPQCTKQNEMQTSTQQLEGGDGWRQPNYRGRTRSVHGGWRERVTTAERRKGEEERVQNSQWPRPPEEPRRKKGSGQICDGSAPAARSGCVTGFLARANYGVFAAYSHAMALLIPGLLFCCAPSPLFSLPSLASPASPLLPTSFRAWRVSTAMAETRNSARHVWTAALPHHPQVCFPPFHLFLSPSSLFFPPLE